MNRLNPIVSNWLISPTAFSNSVWAAAPKNYLAYKAQRLSMVLPCFRFSTVYGQHNWTRAHSDTHVGLNSALAQSVGYKGWIDLNYKNLRAGVGWSLVSSAKGRTRPTHYISSRKLDNCLDYTRFYYVEINPT